MDAPSVLSATLYRSLQQKGESLLAGKDIIVTVDTLMVLVGLFELLTDQDRRKLPDEIEICHPLALRFRREYSRRGEATGKAPSRLPERLDLGAFLFEMCLMETYILNDLVVLRILLIGQLRHVLDKGPASRAEAFTSVFHATD